ncbi:MAG: InlB B-repeat-containing protein, partial [Clostridia bacterium]|nr:InlB B-repeat-containing protein [Clostridia bacterium]
MKNTLRRIMAMALAILMVLTSGPLTAVAEIVSGNQTDVSQGFSLFSLKPYTKTLHATFEYEDETGATKTVSEQYVLETGTLSVPATPEKKDHKFTGWTPSISGAPEPGTTVSADFLAGVDEDPVNVTYTAEFTPVYYVFFHDVAKQESRVIHTEEGVKGTVVEFDNVPNPVLTGDEAFVDWLLNGNAVDSVTIEDKNIDLYPDVRIGHWINYDSGAGATYIEPVFVRPDAVTVAPTNPGRIGYAFSHWTAEAPEEGKEPSGAAYTFGNTLDSSITLYAVWTPQTVNYTVIHFLENANDDNYSYDVSETKTGKTGEQTNAVAKTYSGFEVQEITQQTIAGDGSTIVEVKYDRIEYTIYFYGNGETTYKCGLEEHKHSEWAGCYNWRGQLTCTKTEHSHSDSCIASSGNGALFTITAKHGAYIGDQWPLYNGSSRWAEEKGGDSFQNNIDVMPIGGEDYYAPDDSSSYLREVEYYVSILPGESAEVTKGGVGYKIHHVDRSYGSSSSKVGDEDRYPITGFTINNTHSSPEGFKPYADAQFFYDRNSYKIVFINGGVTDSEVTKLYEESIAGVSYTPARPAGVPAEYTFAGWYDNAAGAGDEYSFAGTMPAKTITVYAKWEAPTYNALVYVTMEGTDTPTQLKVPYGKTINPSDLPEVTLTEEYELHGWSTAPNAYVPFNFDTQIYSNISLYPYYTKKGAFTVSYVDAKNTFTDSAKYADGSHAEVMAPVAATNDDGDVFVYWTASTGGTYYPKDKIAISGNVTLTAVYEAVEDRYTLIYDANGGTGDDTVENLYKNQPIDLYMG